MVFVAENSLRQNIKDFFTQLISYQTTNDSRVDALEAVEQVDVEAEFLKVGFILVGEAEGLLSINSYPFCFGNGSPQAVNFGVGIPFRVNLKNLSLVTNTTDITFLVKIQMIHYSYVTNIETLLGTEYSFQTSNKTQIDITTPGSGHIVFKITFIRGGFDTDRFRLSLVFSADENI